MFTKAERKCHDFLPSFLQRRPFGVQKRFLTNWRTKLARRPFGVFLASFWRTKKLNDLLPSFFEFWTPKCHQKEGKKSQRPFWTAKGRHGEKDGKKSWYLHSPFVTMLEFLHYIREAAQYDFDKWVQVLDKPHLQQGIKCRRPELHLLHVSYKWVLCLNEIPVSLIWKCSVTVKVQRKVLRTLQPLQPWEQTIWN